MSENRDSAYESLAATPTTEQIFGEENWKEIPVFTDENIDIYRII